MSAPRTEEERDVPLPPSRAPARPHHLGAVLAAGPGAVASHRSAARLWELLDHAPIEITVPRGRTPDLWGGVIVHQTNEPPAVSHRRRIPTSSPMRAVLVAAVAPINVVLDAIDRAEVSRVCRVAAIEWQLVELRKRGRRGVAVLQRALDVQAPLDVPPEGMLEPRFARLAKQHKLPPAVFQHPVGRYRIDFAYPT